MSHHSVDALRDANFDSNAVEASERLEQSHRLGIALKVRDFVSNTVALSGESVPTREEMRAYREFEEEKMDALSTKIEEMLSEVAMPAALHYLRKRFPEESSGDFPRFDGLLFRPEYTLSSDENIMSGTLPASPWMLWGCRVVRENWENEIGIEVMLDAVFSAFEDREIEDEVFEDFILQVLLHEVMHSLSVSFYMTEEEKMDAYAKWLAFLEYIGRLDPYPSWEELITRFGYSCNFVASENQAKGMPFRRLVDLDDVNEWLTDIYAARAYSEYRKSKWLPPCEYKFGYPKEAKAFNFALRQFCNGKGYDFNETFRLIEIGYFFGDEEYLDAFENVIWEILPSFKEKLAELRAKQT